MACSKRLGHIFDLRFDIYKKKFLIKFINNFLRVKTHSNPVTDECCEA